MWWFLCRCSGCEQVAVSCTHGQPPLLCWQITLILVPFLLGQGESFPWMESRFLPPVDPGQMTSTQTETVDPKEVSFLPSFLRIQLHEFHINTCSIWVGFLLLSAVLVFRVQVLGTGGDCGEREGYESCCGSICPFLRFGWIRRSFSVYSYTMCKGIWRKKHAMVDTCTALQTAPGVTRCFLIQMASIRWVKSIPFTLVQ